MTGFVVQGHIYNIVRIQYLKDENVVTHSDTYS